MEENKKPLILEMDEAKLEIIQVINNAIQGRKLPCYLLLPIIEGIYRDVQAGAQNELAIARQQVEAQKDEEVA
jgi:hypothetical protein